LKVSDRALYLFSSGTLEAGGVEAPVPFFLVRHPAGDVVIDGGNPLAVARDPRAHWGALADVFRVSMSEAQHCVAQLRRLGIGRDSVRYVVQTHLHMDHTGALGHFSSAPVVVHARELEAARTTDEPQAHGYIPADFERDGLEWRCVEHDLDLFGDGTLQLLQTPGHSAGHMSVLIQLPATGSVLLTADAVDSRAQWERRLPLRVLYSREDAERSLERLRSLADEMHAMVIFGHDSENWSQLRHAPDAFK
jgi:glyoxylase-like metal-dependent hydrolase (beta-lactamase superfamily II)